MQEADPQLEAESNLVSQVSSVKRHSAKLKLNITSLLNEGVSNLL